MAACARETTRQVIWINLRGQNLSFTDFLQLIGESIEPGSGPWQEHALISCLQELTSQTWLMLDDFPRFTDPVFDSAFGRLLSFQYDSIEWWVTSRRRPSCNLPRLMLQGELVELRDQQLLFSEEDISTLSAQQNHDPRLNVQDVYMKTQGWCAAVAFYLMPNVDPDALLLEYLKHELLAKRPAHQVDTLIMLSNIRLFDSALCAQLSGLTPDQTVLDSLISDGAFITKTCTPSSWIQIFPPAARLLASLADKTKMLSAHKIACQYFIKYGEIRLAIEQAVLADTPELAGRLLENLSEAELLNEQAATRVLAYRDQLPNELLESTPRLIILYSYAYAIGSRPQKAMKCLEALAKFLPAPSEGEQRYIISCWQGITGIAAHANGNAQLAGLNCREALESLPNSDWPLQLGCRAVLIQQLLFRGKLAQAEIDISSALTLARNFGGTGIESYIVIYQALLLETRGQLLQAVYLIEGQLNLLDSLIIARPVIRGRLIVRRAYIRLNQGQLELARDLFLEGYRSGMHNADAIGFHGLIGLSTLALLDGNYLQADKYLVEAEKWLQEGQIAETIYRSVIDQSRAAILIETGNLVEARSLLNDISARHGEPTGMVQAFVKADFLYETECLIARIELQNGQDEQAGLRLRRLYENATRHGFNLVLCEINILKAELALTKGNNALSSDLMGQAIEESEKSGFRLPLINLQRHNPKLLRMAGKKPISGLLSSREVEVLKLIEAGHSNQEIADRLFISLFTVKSHIQRLSGKLEVQRRTQAVFKAKSLGLL